MKPHQKHPTDSNAPTREGDVLGISDAAPDPGLPGVVNRGGGHPRGIDVRKPATGIGDVSQHPGATGIDMGGGGEGEAVEDTRTPERRRKAED